MIIHSNAIFLPIYVQTDRFVVLALAYMLLNVNIKLFLVENIYNSSWIIYWNICLKYLYTYLKSTQSLSGSVYRRYLRIYFIATERTPPQTDSLVF